MKFAALLISVVGWTFLLLWTDKGPRWYLAVAIFCLTAFLAIHIQTKKDKK